ncbi:hypothetical protein PPOP_0552 [Paenibacillus popilliae ATCC 14706]|uniref:Uncharacterized protein n=1 Tax=Paenibacillus popilliae ATCC 14706 TaxID=1212764 RepID=M9M267_PAEPP|nr:hypothetical protein PPOP_0552 [Paenibacillus popilliae ATCC 14706]
MYTAYGNPWLYMVQDLCVMLRSCLDSGLAGHSVWRWTAATAAAFVSFAFYRGDASGMQVQLVFQLFLAD